MTSRMWTCVRSFTSLMRLTISDSSLSFPPSPPELPSVEKLSAVRVTSQCYEGVISSLPGVEDIAITMDDAEEDIARYTAVLRQKAGQKLTSISLHCPSSLSPERGRVSRETMRGLGLFIKEHTKNLVLLYLEWVRCTDEDDIVYLIECCRRVKTLQYVWLWFCGTMKNGRLHSHLAHLHRGYSEGLDVDVRRSLSEESQFSERSEYCRLETVWTDLLWLSSDQDTPSTDQDTSYCPV
ncbi:uncharacterized protein LOC121417750 [Lytechinus variegatus]|uniref:uncharacterized protein LOC121417750 n=1 Tax=Lytechinus variegatus TaxID=7654 RepID=UPI001BB189EF|nr:uncharacterized protein LOC121417750 [Lytechinus variegatus]